MKFAISIKSRKPRNPLVAPCHRRLAGAHGRGTGSRRQQAEQALRRELRTGLPFEPSP